jgi:acyl-coenzyme A thioesterase PaaI-like protein
MTSLFTVEADTVRATESSTGPWTRDALHGGPVAALLAHHLEGEHEGGDLFPARLAVELLRPVGHDPVRLTRETIRDGKKVRVVEARLTRANGEGESGLLARGTLQQIRRASVVLPDDHRHIDPFEPAPSQPEDLPPNDARFAADERDAFHNTAVEHRSPDAFFGNLGPAFDWMRVVVDLLPGVPLSPLARVAAAADFGNGISATLPVPAYRFVNPDVTIFLNRLPVDEWIGVDARTRIGDEGVAYAESELFDRDGRIGRSVQTLLVDRN